MLRESYMASMWLAHSYGNTSPARYDRLRQTAEDHVMAWVVDHEPAGLQAGPGTMPRVACSKVLDADRAQVDVSIPAPTPAVPWRELMARFLYVESSEHIERLPPLSPAA